MSESDQQKEIDRILALPEKIDPFTVLGITVFLPRDPKPATTDAATASDNKDGGEGSASMGSNSSQTKATPSSSSSSTARSGGRGRGGDEDAEPDFVRAPIELRDVTRAYRRLNLLLHPDKCSLERAGDALHRVAEANKKLPSEVTVERFLIELERMKRRDWDMARRRALAEEERKRKIAARGGGTSVVGGMAEVVEGNGIANFSTMTMAEQIKAVAELERAERLAETAKKAEAIAKKRAEAKAKEEASKLVGEELMKQATEWAVYMDL